MQKTEYSKPLLAIAASLLFLGVIGYYISIGNIGSTAGVQKVELSQRYYRTQKAAQVRPELVDPIRFTGSVVVTFGKLLGI